MSAVCRVCLGDAEGDVYHPRCLRELFDTDHLPRVDIDLAKLHTAALAMVGHSSLSGVQKKISVGLSADRSTLQVAIEGGLYVLKPQAGTYPFLPENEHLTMLLARRSGIPTPPLGLVPLSDQSMAYVAARFDRRADGRKVRQEDFCQLSERPAKEKYTGSAELCVDVLKRYASEPLVEILRLYRCLVFAWWTGNGDMHLKNLSLQETSEGHQRLTPAYDQLCTQLVIDDDPLALPVQGKRARLTRATWLDFADHSGIPPKAANRALDAQAKVLNVALELIERSFLPAEMKDRYRLLLEDRTAVLEAR